MSSKNLYCLCLKPADGPAQRLSSIIANLAEEHCTAAFPPHMTLALAQPVTAYSEDSTEGGPLGEADGDEEAIRWLNATATLRGACSFSLRMGPATFGATRHQCVLCPSVQGGQGHESLLRLRKGSLELLASCPAMESCDSSDAFYPHISLLDSDMPQSEREKVSATVTGCEMDIEMVALELYKVRPGQSEHGWEKLGRSELRAKPKPKPKPKPTQDKQNPVVDDRRPLRILCLHGHAQSAASFHKKTGSVRSDCTKGKLSEWVYVEAPYEVPACAHSTETGEGPAFTWMPAHLSAEGDNWAWFARTVADSHNATIQLVARTWQEQGPFDGIFAFSRGGALAAALAARALASDAGLALPGLRFMVLSAAYMPLDAASRKLLESGACKALPVLHILGETDQIISAARSRELVPHFADLDAGSRIWTHAGGHLVPSQCRKELRAFLLSQSDAAAASASPPPPPPAATSASRQASEASAGSDL